MAYPPGVDVTRLTFSDGFKYHGTESVVTVTATVNTPVPEIRHTSGATLTDGETITGDTAAFDVPNPSQGGWSLPNGSRIKGWSYDLTVTVTATGQPLVLWSASVSPHRAVETITPGMGQVNTPSGEGTAPPDLTPYATKTYADQAETDAVASAKTYTDTTVAANVWAKATNLSTGNTIDGLASGAYKVTTSAIATALGLPTAATGIVVKYVISALAATVEWHPNGVNEIWTQTKNSTWGPWGRASFHAPKALATTDTVNGLVSGLYAVHTTTVADAMGLPTSQSGSLLVHKITDYAAVAEWRPNGNHQTWTSRKNGSTWAAWERVDGPGTLVSAKAYTDEKIAALPAAGENTAPITGVSLALEDTGQNFIPTSVGVDGQLYGYNTGGAYLMRSGDALSTVVPLGPKTGDYMGPGHGIRYVTRTSSGFLVAYRVDQNTSTMWHSPTWEGPYTKVLDFGPWWSTGLAKPRLVGGQTWLLFGEYTYAQYPSWPLKRFLSTDGGMTWKVVRQTQVVDDQVNAHNHAGLIRGDGRIYSSEGDGPNAWMGYSDDQGASWITVQTDPDILAEYGDTIPFEQPTAMIDFGHTIATSPDRGPYQPSMWSMDPNTHRQQIVWDLTEGGPYTSPAAQFGRSIFVQPGPTGQEAYVMMADGGSGSKLCYIAATPDAGKRWGVVATIPEGALSGSRLQDGIFGPDRNGYMFMRGTNLETYGSNIIRAKLIEWDKTGLV